MARQQIFVLYCNFWRSNINTSVFNAFLRRDGGNTVSSDINLDSHQLTNVLDPADAQDVETKSYVNNKASLPSQKLLASYATDVNTFAWKDFQTIPVGLPESEFDDLPAGLYGCYTGYLPTTRLGILPTNAKGYLLALTYQQPVDWNKLYKWINCTDGREWEAYFKLGA